MIANPNTLRANHFYDILYSYCRRSSVNENLIDILTDAMHWCFLNGRDFDAFLLTARMHIEFERRGCSIRGSLSSCSLSDNILINNLFDQAKAALDFANDHTEVLDFDEYATVSEIETKLLAFGNLLETSDRDAFLKEELRMATEILADLGRRKGVKPG